MIDQIKTAIDKHVVESPNNNRGFELRMSAAGDCVRKLEYDSQLGREVPNAASAFRMGMGEPIHAMWRELLGGLYPNDFEFAEDEVQVDFEVDGEKIVVPGHADGTLRFLDAVVEVKGTSDSTFHLVKNSMKPLPAHMEQANVYAYAHSKKGILFIYQNRDSGEYLLLLELFSELLLMSTIEKWSTVVRNRKRFNASGELKLSERPYQDATCSPCFFCSWKNDCYVGYAESVAKMGAAEAKDPEILSLSSRYALARRGKLDNEKFEETAKTDIALWMLDKKLNTVKTPEGLILLKVGKNNSPLVSLKPAKEG